MHNSKGAWSETLHVYLPAIIGSHSIPRNDETWRVTSIGLGLGYNEILTAAWALKNERSPSHVKIFSFESQYPLRQAFEAFFCATMSNKLDTDLRHAYQHICQTVCAYLELNVSSLVAYIAALIESRALELHGALNLELIKNSNKAEYQSHCVLFDAFSPESSPDLWQINLLESIVNTYCSPSCYFASYASRTALKRILKSHSFNLQKSSGFAGKRERTFARR